MSDAKGPRADRQTVEQQVRACYSSWSSRYYDDYYRGDAYPPVHVDIVRAILQKAGARSLLDAGCGPASMLRELALPGLERWGFDITPSMTQEARRVLAADGMPSERIWDGSVLDGDAFAPRAGAPGDGFDAAICFGVLPHVPEPDDRTVLTNLRNAVRPGGLIALEARNQLFALFTLNRYSRAFFRDTLIDVAAVSASAADAPERAALDKALASLDERFRVDLPPVRRGEAGQPGYDEVLSRTHNPLLLRELARSCGLIEVDVLFYHFHALPPMLEAEAPALFRRASLAMENPRDWRGHFMASAFVLVGRRPD